MVLIGVETGPRIGLQKGPPLVCGVDGTRRSKAACDAPPHSAVASKRRCGGQRRLRMALRQRSAVRRLWSRSGAVLEAPAVVAGLDDLAVMGQSAGATSRR